MKHVYTMESPFLNIKNIKKTHGTNTKLRKKEDLFDRLELSSFWVAFINSLTNSRLAGHPEMKF